MAKGINKAIIIGNLGDNPEVRYTPSGDAVVNFSVATSETWKDKQTGQPQERTEWHRCTAFRKLADIIGQYCQKGSKVYIEGKLRTRQWEQDGVKRYTTEISVDQFQMLDSRQDGGQNAGQNSRPPVAQQPQQAPQTQPQGGFGNDFDDDIPF